MSSIELNPSIIHFSLHGVKDEDCFVSEKSDGSG